MSSPNRGKPLNKPKYQEKAVQPAEGEIKPEQEPQEQKVEVQRVQEQKEFRDTEDRKKPMYAQKKEKYEDRKEKYGDRKERYRVKDTGGYDFDKSNIDENTVVPKLPKKEDLLPYPDDKVYQEREQTLLDQISALKNKKNQVFNSKFVREKYPSSVTEDPGFSQFDKQNDELGELSQQKSKILKEINARKGKIQKVADELEDTETQLKSLEGEGKSSKESLQARLNHLKSDLITVSLLPKEEKQMNQEIEQIKKQLVNAVSFEDIEIQRTKLRDRRTELFHQRDQLYKEKKPFNDNYDEVNKRLNVILASVKDTRQKFDQMKKAKVILKEETEKGRQEFLDEREKKKREIQEEINQLYDKADTVWDEYYLKLDEHSKQSQYIKHAEWVAKEKDYVLKRKEREEKKKLYEERDRERQEREVQMVKMRPKKYTPNIKNCEFLIGYCERLMPKEAEVRVEKQQDKLSAEELEKKLAADTQWKKEKGVTLIQSKKTQDNDTEINLKPKRTKKVENIAEKPAKPTSYTHDFNISNLFEAVKTSPPQTEADLGRVIKDLREKVEYFEKMNAEEGDTEPERRSYTTKPEDGVKPTHQPTKLQTRTQDFPQL